MLERLLGRCGYLSVKTRRRGLSVRLLPLALAAGLLGYSTVSAALGLGELTLRSYLNQPFKADINLTDTAGLEADEVSAGLASADEYARAGIERVFFLNDLRFAPDFSRGRQVLHVTSSKAVTEPYLSFLVAVNRPGGQLLRAYTVLLDPPGTVSLPPAPVDTPAKQPVRAAAAPRKAAAPSAPATAAVAAADPQLQKSLEEMRARLQLLQTEVDVKDQQLASLETQLSEAKAAAPAASEVAPAKVASSAPTTAVPAPAATVPVVATAPATTPAPAPAPAPAPSAGAGAAARSADASVPLASPAPAASVMPTPVSEEDNSWLLLLGAGALLLLLVALLLLVRRNRQRHVVVAADEDPESADSTLVTPAQLDEAPVVVPSARTLAQQEPVAASRRESATATDALDGASIYIAYGRFNEALGILREGVIKQPDRTDLRLRILEVLGQQGDLAGFDAEEAEMLAIGFSAEKIHQVRAQSPKLAHAAKVAETASVVAPAAVAAATVAAAVALQRQEPEPQPPVIPPADVPMAQPPQLVSDPVDEPDFDFDLESLGEDDLQLLDDNPQADPAAQEFQLNLDDLSMDADWDAVSPFAPAIPTRKPAPSVVEEPPTVDPVFDTNLRELPDVYEMPDEQFLSDFADLDEPFLESEPVQENLLSLSQDDIDNDFLNSFGDDADFELDSLSVDFDSLESQQASAEKLEQAQGMIDMGNTQGASDLLHELLRDGDDACKASARQLLASLS